MLEHIPELNSTKELLYQTASIVISIVVPAVIYYVLSLLKNSSFATKYNLNNERTERVMENAIIYAEEKALQYVDKQLDKRTISLEYIEKIDPAIIKKHGDKINMMLDRKVPQVLKKKILG